MLSAALALTLAVAPARIPNSPVRGPGDAAKVTVAVDSSDHLLTITSGPHQVAGMSPEAMRAMATGPIEHHGMLEPFRTFTWPIDGWLRSVTMRITDGQGHEVSSRLVHHLNLVNLDRRQLFYAMPERVIALGQETGDIKLPPSIGMPVKAGSHMGLVVMWHNMSTTDYHDLKVTLTIEWMPTNMYPRPLDVWPVYLDVVNPIGRPVDFDLPAGKQRFQADFTMPITGRAIGVGGHLHDYGTGLVLTDITDAKPQGGRQPRHHARLGQADPGGGAEVPGDQRSGNQARAGSALPLHGQLRQLQRAAAEGRGDGPPDPAVRPR